MNLPNNIIECDDICTIYPRKASLIARLTTAIIFPNVMLVGILWLMNNTKSDYTWFWIVAIVFIYIISIFEILAVVRQVQAPRPIILTKRDVTLSNGGKIEWKNTSCLYRVRERYGFRLVMSYTNEHWHSTINIELYANRKTIVELFEKYAGKKLYDPHIRYH